MVRIKNYVLYIIFSIFFVINSNSYGQFNTVVIIDSTLINGYEIVTGDINNDNRPDIIITGSVPNLIGSYINLGGNNFSSLNIISNVFDTPYSPILCDLDNDGDQDLVATSVINDIAWFENDGIGNFASPQPISGNITQTRYVSNIDLDADNDQDIIAAGSFDDEVAWYENLGGGTFAPKQIISSVDIYPWRIKSEDMDNDNDKDIVVGFSYTNDGIGWYENLGSEVFSSLVMLTTSCDALTDMTISDVDENGFKDIVYCSAGDDRVAWISNIGGGIFLPIQNVSITADVARGITVNDFDNDGDVDIASVSEYSDKAEWFVNNGNSDFVTTSGLADISYLRKISSADSDSDGDEDLFVLSKTKLFFFENLYHAYQVTGNVFLDENQNSIFDSNDIVLPGVMIDIDTSAFAITDFEGNYKFGTWPGVYQVKPRLNSYWNITSDSSEYQITLSDTSAFIDSLNFGIFPDSTFISLEANVTNGLPRCNLITNVWIQIINKGTCMAKGQIEYIHDPAILFISSNPSPDSIIANRVYWNYDSLLINELNGYIIYLQMPGITSVNDTLSSILIVNSEDNSELLTYTNNDTSYFELVCAFDPNEKLVDPDGYGEDGFILPGEILEYTVYFQNTGNDTAFNVLISDTLDENLDWTTFEIIAQSHDLIITFQNNTLNFRFNNIMLPDSNVNETGSHGFVKYRISAKDSLSSWNRIENTANIYFDYNPAIITNTVYNTICETFPGTPLNTTLPENLSICAGNSTLLSATGINFINWYDNNGAFLGSGNSFETPILNGTSTFYAKDSTCFTGTSFIPVTVFVDSSMNFGITLQGDILSSSEHNADSYQWIDCNSNAIIPGAINFSYTPATPGSYAVILENNFCSDTTECFSVTSVNVLNSTRLSFFTVYPNPTDGILFLETKYPCEIFIYNQLGELVQKEDYVFGNYILNISTFSNGIYHLKVMRESETHSLNIFKLNY